MIGLAVPRLALSRSSLSENHCWLSSFREIASALPVLCWLSQGLAARAYAFGERVCRDAAK